MNTERANNVQLSATSKLTRPADGLIREITPKVAAPSVPSRGAARMARRVSNGSSGPISGGAASFPNASAAFATAVCICAAT